MANATIQTTTTKPNTWDKHRTNIIIDARLESANLERIEENPPAIHGAHPVEKTISSISKKKKKRDGGLFYSDLIT